jgi:NAD(P)-dependent dehydrogenase (short-subunit alcohol dehydrogenase family)
MDLKDKVIIITGSGRGIGAAAAELCAQNGAKVVICDINDQWGQKVLEKICAQGLEANYFHADVSKESEVEALVKFTVEKYGRLDGIVNNAATIVVKPIAELTAEEWGG